MPRNQGTSRKGKPGKWDREAGMGKALQKAQGQRYRPKVNGRAQGGGGMAMQEGTHSLGLTDRVEEKTKSILEYRDLDDFLIQAEMANREFVSEKEGLVILDEAGQLYRPQNNKSSVKTEFVFTELSVPRRPPWNEHTTPDELEQNEMQFFLEWRRGIAAREEEIMKSQSSASATPFEKNLEVWRQLWRVLERSACLLQLVDARNPLFYLSEDLRQYASSLGKPMMVLINKSDYLSQAQREAWRVYLLAHNWDPVFFSAALEQEKLDQKARAEKRKEQDATQHDLILQEEDSDDDKPGVDTEQVSQDGRGVDVPLNRLQLLDTMLKFAREQNCQPDPRFDNRIQFGMVGFPNVGKSSVINVLIGNSKHTHGLVRVAVAAQPGKTKHFQTLLLPDPHDDIMLCDCPGLVFPSFVSNTADLIAAGVYPISNMRNHWPVIQLICQRIPRQILNAQYGIKLPVLSEQQLKEQGLAQQPLPSGEEFLGTLCVARGMLAASSGVPDYTRAARMVIKDYSVGKLLYCHAPPDIDDLASFYRETVQTSLNRTAKLRAILERAEQKAATPPVQQQVDIDIGEEEDDDDEEEDSQVVPGDTAVAPEVDLDLLEFLGGPAASTQHKPQQPSKRSKKKGGRKKKGRNEDPYGCHTNPDDIMLHEVGITGVSVKGAEKKFGNKKGYTRPTGYGFTTNQAIS